MDCKTIVELLLTGVIAVFTGLTWRATRIYGYLYGMTLFIQTHKESVGISQGVERPTAIRTMRALRKAFPKVCKDMSECLNPET